MPKRTPHFRKEMLMEVTRREALGVLAAAGSAAFVSMGRTALAQEKGGAVAGQLVPAGKHEPVPLSFDPKKLRGLSERLLVSHHDNNYAGAVKNLNKVEEQLATVTKDTPGFLVAGLKERELTFTNSVILHELYFGNLGGDGKPAGAVASAVGASFGALARFEEVFRATGMSLAGGSGWTVLDYSFQTNDLRVYWSGGHSQALAFGAPLLVLDMYEHAYAIDYGSAAAQYVDAFMANVNWEAVNQRYERARKAGQALRG
jgi:superoxide dismutase, Fe-Mn family